MNDRSPVVALLENRGAASIEHPGGTLLEHLVRVAGLLDSWGASRDLVLAGLAHAAYGTDGFAIAPFRLDERALVASVVGQRAEEIVYRYASCDRGHTLHQIGNQPTVELLDRFTGVVTPLTPEQLREFAELTFANELDLIGHSESFRRDFGPNIGSMFAGWHAVVSDAAYTHLARALPGITSG